MRDFELANVAYDEYMKILGLKIPMETMNFADLDLSVQAAWIAAATKVYEIVYEEFDE